MPETEQTKVCPLCAETIKAAAKVCPHCRYWQKKWSLQNPHMGVTLYALACCAAFIFLIALGDKFFGPKRDFAAYQNQITVVSSETSFRMVHSNLTVSVVGVVTNQSEFNWKQVALEAQLFDKNGKLIDVIQAEGEYGGVTVFPHAEAAFKIEHTATKNESEYKSTKVFIRSAKDIRTWP